MLRIAKAIAGCVFFLYSFSFSRFAKNCHSHGFSRTLHAGRKTIRPLSPPPDHLRPPNSEAQCGQDLLRHSYQYDFPPLPQRRSRPATFSTSTLLRVPVHIENIKTDRSVLCLKNRPHKEVHQGSRVDRPVGRQQDGRDRHLRVRCRGAGRRCLR